MNQFGQHRPEQKQEGTRLEKQEQVALPIDAYKEAILEAVKQNPSTVLVGETGSGKTTRTPLFLLEAFKDAKIAVTSPRVLPARSVSKYVAGQLNERVGETVGVITRDTKEISPKTRCFFMTDGVLLNMLRKDPALTDLDIVMVDEAHERGLNVDFSLGLLKRSQKLRQEKGLEELKIVVASATLEEEKFTNYFSDAPLTKVPGRLFPVDTVYLKPELITDKRTRDRRLEDSTEHAARVAQSVVQDMEKDGDILIFMPGEAEIRKTLQELSSLESSSLELLPLFGSMNPQDQDKIFTRNGKRKIIVSTNIAETSLTIDTVRHVIDSGTLKQKSYNPVTGIDTLAVQEASKANMDQRKGRAGRVSSGWCYRLMSEQEYESYEAFAKPEILRSNLAEVVLKMKDMGIDDIEGFEFVDQPSTVAIHDAVRQLTALGALDEQENITELGKEMVELPLRPDLSRALLEAKKLKCLPLMVDVAAMMSLSEQLFFRAKDNDPEGVTKEVRQKSLQVEGSDYLTALSVWRTWQKSNYSAQFAIDHLLNVKALREAGQVRDLLLQTLGKVHLTLEKGEGQESSEKELLTRCLLASKPESIFYVDYSGRWPVYNVASQNSAGKKGVSIFPGSSCFKKFEEPKYFLGEDIYTNDKHVTYVRKCHTLTLEELKKAVPHLVEEKVVTENSYYGPSSKDVVLINGVQVSSTYKESSRSSSLRAEPLPDIFMRTQVRAQELLEKDNKLRPYQVNEVMVEGKSIGERNREVIALLKDYRARNRTLTYVVPDVYELAEDVLARGTMKTLEDVAKNKEVFLLNRKEYLREEDMEETDRLSPRAVPLGGVMIPVVYEDPYRFGELFKQEHPRKAALTFDLQTVTSVMKDKQGSFDVSLPLVDEIQFLYRYEDSRSGYASHYTHTKHFKSFKELAHFALTNHFEAEERERVEVLSGGMSKEEKEKFFSTLVADEVEVLNGALDTKEKKEKLAGRLGSLRTIFPIVEELLKEKMDSKTRNKVLSQIIASKKEVRTTLEAVEDYKRTPIKVEAITTKIRSFEKLLTDSDMLSLLEIIDKRYLGLVYKNLETLERAVQEGEVDYTDELKKKVITKAFQLLVGHNPKLLTPSEAGDILIEELL